MRDGIKQIASEVMQHPKAASAIVAGATSANAWLIDYEPMLKITTSILGIILVCVLIVKHVIDIVKELQAKGDD